MEISYIHRVRGQGIVATKDYQENEVIYELNGEILDHPTKYSIEIGENKHIIDKYGIYLNHSFNPNIKIDGIKLIALKFIKKNDELSFNYNDNETKMNSPFYDGDKYVKGKE